MKPLSSGQTTRVVLAATGLVQGFVYFLAHEFWPDGPAGRALLAAAIFFVTVAAATVFLAWTGSDTKRLAALGLGIPAVFGLVTFWVWQQIPVGEALYQGDDARAPTWIMGTALAVYVLLPFIQIYQRSGRPAFPYPDLFRHSWNNFFIVAIGAFLAGAFWLVILLWYELFKLIDITFFEDVFTSAPFVSMSLTTVFGYGVSLGRESERVTNTLRGITLAIFRTLMPLLALIALLFLASLPFTGLQPLWDTGHASAVLLSLIALTILFFNAVFQDGETAPLYTRWVRHGIEAALVAMPIYAAITFYAIGLRIGQYGLTPERFYAELFAVVGALYAVGYATVVFGRRGTWMGNARRVNIWMVWIVTALAVLVHTPVLDPLRWSARNQFGRLARGDVDASAFDYGFLRFRLGHAGAERLAALEGLSDHPDAEIITDRARVAREVESYRELRRRPTVLLSAADVEFIRTVESPPADLLPFVGTDLTRRQTDACLENQDCVIFALDLDADPGVEYVMVLSGETSYSLLAYDRGSAGTWERIGSLGPVGRDADLPDRATLLDTLSVSGARAVDVPYRDMMIGNLRFRLRR